MANPVPAAPPDPNAYPQWGIQVSGTSGTVIEAKNATAKQADMGNGYLDWFPTKAAAQNALSSQTSPAGSGGQSIIGAITGVPEAVAKLAAGLAGFFTAVEDGSLWKSLGWIAAGFVLIVIGLIYLLRKPAGSALKTGARTLGSLDDLAAL